METVYILITAFSIGALFGSIYLLQFLSGKDKIAKKAKKLRNIKIGLLFTSGILYRIHIIVIQSIFFWYLTGRWKWAIGASIGWNIINTILYYNWHYWFARLFKIGKG